MALKGPPQQGVAFPVLNSILLPFGFPQTRKRRQTRTGGRRYSVRFQELASCLPKDHTEASIKGEGGEHLADLLGQSGSDYGVMLVSLSTAWKWMLLNDLKSRSPCFSLQTLYLFSQQPNLAEAPEETEHNTQLSLHRPTRWSLASHCHWKGGLSVSLKF